MLEAGFWVNAFVSFEVVCPLLQLVQPSALLELLPEV
jgi:hypothetical protein